VTSRLGKLTPMWATGKVEDVLRGPMNAGVVPELRQMVAEVQGNIAAGRQPSGALLKRLDEYQIPYEVAAEGLSPELLMHGMATSADRLQFHTGIGQIGSALTTPSGRIASSLLSYGQKASNATLDDVLKPLFSSDPSLRALGMGRLSPLISAGLAAETLREGVRSTMQARPFDPANVVWGLADTNLGPYSAIPRAGLGLYQGLSSNDWKILNQMAGQPAYAPAAAALPSSLLSNLIGSLHGKRQGVHLLRGAVDAGTLFGPEWSRGIIGLARPTVLGLTAPEHGPSNPPP